MKTKTPIASILRQKGDWVITIHPTATVYETIARMVDNNVGAILIKDEGEVRGIFTERDYLRRIALQGRTSKTTRVEEVMTGDVLTVDLGETAENCLRIMTANKCRHLPVLKDGHLTGLISIGDCVKELLLRAEGQVQELENYITGSYPG